MQSAVVVETPGQGGDQRQPRPGVLDPASSQDAIGEAWWCLSSDVEAWQLFQSRLKVHRVTSGGVEGCGGR